MKKSLIITISIVSLICVAGASIYWYINRSPTTDAFVKADGVVEVNKGSGWSDVQNRTHLGLADTVRTGPNGSATIVFYESVMVDLEADTEVVVEQVAKDHVKVRQKSGVTWSSFSDVLGVGQATVKTPTTTATVRGTQFQTTTDEVLVAEGTVGVTVDQQTHNVSEGHKMAQVNGTMQEVNLTAEERTHAVTKMNDSLRDLKALRNQRIRDALSRYGSVADQLFEQYNASRSDMWAFVERVDNGDHDVDELLDKAPITPQPVQDIAAMTKEIQEQKEHMQSMK